MPDPLPPADDLPIPVAYLVSVLLESAFWGAYAVLFGISIWIIVYKRKSEQANKPMLYAVVVLFIFSTAHIAIQWARIYIAFFEQGDTPDGARLYLQSAGIPMSILSETVYGILSIMADSLLIYRAWIVWNRNIKVIIVPMIVLVVSAGVAAVATYELLQGGPHGTVLAPAVHTWSTTYFVLALATNIAVTMIIAYRIWSISRESADTLGQVRTRKYMSVIGIVIESGAIYVVLMIPMVILFACNYFAKLIPFNILGQVMGMVPTLIIVRVGLGHSIDDQYGGQVSQVSRTHYTSTNGGRITPATNSKILISVTRTQTGDEYQLGKYPASGDQSDGVDSSLEGSFHRSKSSRDMSPV